MSYPGAGSLGMAAPMASSAAGGWSCGAIATGARCTHGPLVPGQTATAYLPVAISPNAVLGVPPAVTVSSAGMSVTARAGSGVMAQGLPARFAAESRLDTIVAGNFLPRRSGWYLGGPRLSSPVGVAVPGNVLWAGLYWSGTGAPAQISTRGPGGGGYQDISAASAGTAYLGGTRSSKRTRT